MQLVVSKHDHRHSSDFSKAVLQPKGRAGPDGPHHTVVRPSRSQNGGWESKRWHFTWMTNLTGLQAGGKDIREKQSLEVLDSDRPAPAQLQPACQSL